MKKTWIARYRKFHWLDKTLDLVLLLGIGLSLLFLIAEFFLPSQGLASFIVTADVLLLGIFFMDMSRTFFKSKNLLDFSRHHWPDMVVVSIIIVSLSSVLFLGLGRISWLVREGKVFKSFGGVSSAGVGRLLRRFLPK